jgi:hypothetical protein
MTLTNFVYLLPVILIKFINRLTKHDKHVSSYNSSLFAIEDEIKVSHKMTSLLFLSKLKSHFKNIARITHYKYHEFLWEDSEAFNFHINQQTY